MIGPVNNMKKIFVKTHLGLGDNIVCNGMMRKLSEDYHGYEVHCASKTHNFENVKFMYRDNPNIHVHMLDDMEVESHLMGNFYEQVFNCSASYDEYILYGDDIFYKKIGMDPLVRKNKFYLDRDYNKEMLLYNKIIDEIGSEDFIFIHEKKDENILVNKNKINSNLPIVYAEKHYGIFELLTLIEKAKQVHIISSSFLSFFMTKKYNENTFAHMYADRKELINIVRKNNIEVIK